MLAHAPWKTLNLKQSSITDRRLSQECVKFTKHQGESKVLPGLSCLSTTESGKWSRKAESLKRAVSWEFLSWVFEILSEFFCLVLQTSQPIGKFQANCSMEIKLQVVCIMDVYPLKQA